MEVYSKQNYVLPFKQKPKFCPVTGSALWPRMENKLSGYKIEIQNIFLLFSSSSIIEVMNKNI